jgi:hypothetical protein
MPHRTTCTNWLWLNNNDRDAADRLFGSRCISPERDVQKARSVALIFEPGRQASSIAK